MKYNIRLNIMPTARSDGSHALRLRVTWNGKRVDCCLDNGIMPAEWDAALGMPKRTQKKALREIDERRAAVAHLFDIAHVERRIPSPDEVRKALGMATAASGDKENHLMGETFLRFLREQGSADNWSDGTMRRFRVLLSHLLAWDSNATVEEMSEERMKSFASYLYSNGLVNSTVSKDLAQLRWFLHWCRRQGFTEDETWDYYRPRLHTTEREVVYLTEEEIQRLMSLDLTATPYLDRVRDVFLFLCFTGLRYSDAAKLSRDDIRDGFIHVVTKKTADPLRIELNNISASILDRYASDPLPLPIISNQKMNGYLKQLGRMADIDEPVRRVYWVRSERKEEVFPKWQLLTSHCGRRTFVVTALRLEIPAEVIMRWTGHSDHKAMRPYVAIVDKLKQESMAKFDRLFPAENKKGH